MTPSEAQTVMDWLMTAWPQAAKFWPVEHLDLLQEDMTKLNLSPGQCIARLRELARRHGTTLPDLRKDVWAALEALDRSQSVQATAKAEPGHGWTLVEHLRNTWGHPWTEMNDDAVMWQYAKLRARKQNGKADEVGACVALEFETRSLGWDRDRVRSVLLEHRCFTGLGEVERQWEEVDKKYAARQASMALIGATP